MKKSRSSGLAHQSVKTLQKETHSGRVDRTNENESGRHEKEKPRRLAFVVSFLFFSSTTTSPKKGRYLRLEKRSSASSASVGCEWRTREILMNVDCLELVPSSNFPPPRRGVGWLETAIWLTNEFGEALLKAQTAAERCMTNSERTELEIDQRASRSGPLLFFFRGAGVAFRFVALRFAKDRNTSRWPAQSHYFHPISSSPVRPFDREKETSFHLKRFVFRQRNFWKILAGHQLKMFWATQAARAKH